MRAKERERLEKYTSVVPNHRQKRIQGMGFYAFMHYGINTFYAKEWSDGTLDPSAFNPSEQNTDQWCEIIKAAGMQGIILTAKHHDGFCLWQTKTTQYSIKNSPYKNGSGDVVAELAASCKKYGLKLGIYLSPWDRNSEYYGTPKYDDFYELQLRELLTGYGELFCIWMDGACGAAADGKEKQQYDYDRIYKTVLELQPNCALSNCGPDVRWVGNEAGKAREAEWNVVAKLMNTHDEIAKKSQQDAIQNMKKKAVTHEDADLGSREVLANYDEFIWYPSEVDVSIRRGWFYHANQDKTVKPLKQLMQIYYTSVGGNSVLLLNIPPDKRGLIHERDESVLREMGSQIDKAFAARVNPISIQTKNTPKAGFEVENLLNDKTYSPLNEAAIYSLEFILPPDTNLGKIVLKEDCNYSQRVESFSVYSIDKQGVKKLYSGTTIGFKRIVCLDGVRAERIKIVIDSCRFEPYMESIEFYSQNENKTKGCFLCRMFKKK